MDADKGLDFEPQSLGNLGSDLLQAIDSPGSEPVVEPVLEAPVGFGDTLSGRPSKTITADDINAAEADLCRNAPPAPQPPAPAEPPAAPQPPAAQSLDLIQEAQKFGLDTSKYGNDPSKLLQGLLHAQRLIGQRDEFAVWGRQLAENPQAVFEALKKQFDKPQPQAPTEPQAPQYPEFDESWLDLIDPVTGQPKPGADPNILAKIRKWNDFAAKRGRELLVAPEKVVLPAVEKRVQELLAAELNKVRQEQDQKLQERDHVARLWNEGQALLMEERNWIYVEGDPSKGPTPAGQVFDKHLRQAVELGIPTLRAQKEWAKSQAIIEMSQNPSAYMPQAPQPSAPAGKQQRAQAIERRPGGAVQPRVPSADEPWPAGTTLAAELAKLVGAE